MKNVTDKKKVGGMGKKWEEWVTPQELVTAQELAATKPIRTLHPNLLSAKTSIGIMFAYCALRLGIVQFATARA